MSTLENKFEFKDDLNGSIADIKLSCKPLIINKPISVGAKPKIESNALLNGFEIESVNLLLTDVIPFKILKPISEGDLPPKLSIIQLYEDLNGLVKVSAIVDPIDLIPFIIGSPKLENKLSIELNANL